MSIDENTNVETPDVNLDDFATEFFGGNEVAPDSAKSEEVEETDEEVSDAPTNDDTQSEAPDEEEEADLGDDDSATEDTEEPEADDSPKKTRFQKRIDELTAKSRESERQRDADRASYEARIAALEAKLNQNTNTEDKPTKATGPVEPTPNDKNEDGEDKYPLGEFDPNYLKDITKFTIEQEYAQREAAKQQEAAEARRTAEKQELENSWTEKLTPARERYPDFNEKGAELIGTFDTIDEAYGEYLQSALMALDNGPDVLYYLANNLEEADRIVKSGPMRATAAFGRIDSMFTDQVETPQTPKRKVSKAPTPPPANKGSSVAKGNIDPSSDGVDLDALARELAKRRY